MKTNFITIQQLKGRIFKQLDIKILIICVTEQLVVSFKE